MSASDPLFNTCADALERDAAELEGARNQEVKPQHLSDRAARTAIHACRIILQAVNQGFEMPRLFQLFKFDRNSDKQVLSLWRLWMVTWLRSVKPSEFAAGAGSADFPAAKTDSEGTILSRDGLPSRFRVTDRQGNEELLSAEEIQSHVDDIVRRGLSIKRIWETALVTDDYDDADWLAHLRNQAKDWADACRAAAKVLRRATPAEGTGAPRDQGEAGQVEGVSVVGKQNDNQPEALSPLQYDILDALRNLKATDPEKRATGPEVAAKVGGGATEQSVKAPLADLKKQRLVDSKTGRHGGTWLTSDGLRCINMLRPKH